jgi:nondiscriminating glutamyl-tRNA synthetase
VRTGLFAWLFARQAGGAYVIRIEDTDQERSERQFEDLIFEDLRWMGLDWDEGPDIGGPFGPYRQSERHEIYRKYALDLVEAGRAYWCFCSEDELEARAESARAAGESWKYPGTCRSLTVDAVKHRLAQDEPSVVRLRVRQGAIQFHDIVHGDMEFDGEIISDPILLRSDGWPTYNYAVVVDDALMKITHVIRGDDHLSNTPKQVLIYEALDMPMPEFAHLSTILGPDHARLSKRHGATAVSQFREAGYLPEALVNYIALLGWSPVSSGSEIIPQPDLVRQFRLDRVNKSPAVFDANKLDFINRHYMKTSPAARGLVAGELERSGWMPKSDQESWLAMVLDTIVPGVNRSSEIPQTLARMLDFPLEDPADIQDTLQDPAAIDLLRLFSAELDSRPDLTTADFRSIAAALKDATKRKGKQLFHPVRAALTMKSSGPELDKLIPMIEAAARLKLQNVTSCRERAKAFLERYG